MKNRMNGMWRSLVSMLMALCLVVGLVPSAAFATEELPTIEDVEAALKDMAQLVAENYDEAYAEAYQYALANGYIAYANEGLDMAIAALEDLDAAALLAQAEQDPALVDEAEALQAEALGALEAAKTLLNEADVLDQATLEAFLALVDQAVAAYEALVVLLEEAGVIAAAEAAYAELVNVVIPALTAKLEEAVKVGAAILMEKVEAKLAELNAAVAAKLAELKAELEAAVAEAKAEIEAKIAELKAQLEELKAQLEAAIEEAKAEIEALIAEVEQKIAEAKAYLEELQVKLLALNAAIEAVIAEGAAAFDQLQAALEDLIAMAPEALVEAVQELKAYLAELYYNATHGEYTITEDSLYIALGDSVTAAEDGYVAKVAAGMTEIAGEYDFLNKGVEDLTIQEIAPYLEAAAADIAKADLITLNFSNYGFTTFTKDYMLAVASEQNPQLDWATYVTAEGVPYVEELKAELYNELVAAGANEMGASMDIDVAAMATAAVEAYAYSHIAYTANLPQVVDAIQAINPEALVIVVGTYNPLEDMTVDVEGKKVNIGEYMQYLVDAANVTSLAYALVEGNVVYVDAPAVEVVETETELALLDVVMAILRGNLESLLPSEAGHAYIAEQILNALTITVAPDAMLGDADGNGVINTLDAMMVLQHYAELPAAAAINQEASDVDGNGVINTIDAMLILQYYAEIITSFPAEG